jgi:Flp pilus assembly protein TadB
MKSTYLQRAAQFADQANTLGKRYNQYSLVRLLLFILFIGIAIYLFTTFHFLVGTIFIIAFLFAFYRFILWHQKIQQAQKHHEQLAQVNEWEAACLDHDYQAYEDGADCQDPLHPYAIDLDLFGPYSIFQYINRTGTALGRQQLANWLKKPATPSTIQERQSAVTELKDMLDWRQHFQAYGLEANDQLEEIELLHKWLGQSPYISDKKWLVSMLYIIPVWSAVVCVLWALYLPWYMALLLFLPAMLILRQYVERINRTHIETTHAEKALAHYARLIKHIEEQDFQAPALQQLQQQFELRDQKASVAIQRLSYIISQLNVRYNAFAIVLNILGLWDLQWVYRLEKWKAEMKETLPKWFKAMAQFEALSSMGNLYHNNPEWIIPSLHDDALFDTIQIGHPLIHKDKRICNDIKIPTDGHIKLVTGSNMAGKSTFLRTVGLNIVLAMSGSPVCASRFAMPPLQVYTSMRTQDALHESTSSFFAELKRLKFIIEAVEATASQETPSLQTFFLLDEILKGTNSNDRHTGSKALIRQLIRSRGSGIIATHDLELGQLEAEASGTIENLRIEVEIKDGQLHFDYKLKKGVSQSFNATLLMKQMGIKIEDEGL